MGRSSSPGFLRRRCVLGAVLLTLSAAASAQLTPLEKEQLTGFRQVGPNQYVRVTGGTDSVRAITSSGAGVQVSDVGTLAGKAGPMQVAAKSNLGMAKVRQLGAKALTGLGWALPQVGLWGGMGLALWELYDQYRIRPDGAGGLIKDSGVPPETVTGDMYRAPAGRGSNWHSSAQAACEENAGGSNGVSYGGNCTRTTVYTGYVSGAAPGTCYANIVSTSSGPACGDTWTESGRFVSWIEQSVQQQPRCPASIDPFDPQYSIPAGAPVGPDGKCQQARGHWQPVTPEVAAQDVAASDKWAQPGVKEAAVEKGLDAGARPVPDSVESSGPASQVGEKVTTTTTDAQGTKTTVTEPTYNYTYGGNEINVTTTTTTVTCAGAGACSTANADTTTTTDGKPPEAQDPLCEQYPDILACQKLGDAPGDQVPKRSQSVDFAAENLGLASGCPPPVVLPGGQQISYQSLCDGVQQARPLIIAMGFLMAAGIMVGGFKLE